MLDFFKEENGDLIKSPLNLYFFFFFFNITQSNSHSAEFSKPKDHQGLT